MSEKGLGRCSRAGARALGAAIPSSSAQEHGSVNWGLCFAFPQVLLAMRHCCTAVNRLQTVVTLPRFKACLGHLPALGPQASGFDF